MDLTLSNTESNTIKSESELNPNLITNSENNSNYIFEMHTTTSKNNMIPKGIKATII